MWEQIKNRIDSTSEPKKETVLNATRVLEGSHGKDGHALEKYTYVIEKNDDIELSYQWAFCPKCRQTRWAKFIAFNHPRALSYERYFIKHGDRL